MAEAQPHNCCGRCCCCLFGVIWKLVIAIIILIVLAILIFFFIVQPHSFKFSVKEAKLTEFNYNNNTLRYNLMLNFTAHNPNKKLTIYYDKMEGRVSYEGTRFATMDDVNSFRQDTKKTNRISGVFSGQRVVVFDHDQVSDIERDKKDGAFHFDVKLYFRIRFRLGDFIDEDDIKGNIKCGLDVPFVASKNNGTKVMNAFEPTTCDVNL
ncbi:hypothetical protein TSUD_399850 [Trifolium subterraneum]|uniref:Late embryogenesis abundant protein LEA-2 subgroup domain-containing protein n=1 Tax=Trifolium subterraneum TaxID=3900 RepID=A0A2Z6NJW5_TRISU|nr:hypothetical protein TSUD_399850 [Trifolium subterraneum]